MSTLLTIFKCLCSYFMKKCFIVMDRVGVLHLRVTPLIQLDFWFRILTRWSILGNSNRGNFRSALPLNKHLENIMYYQWWGFWSWIRLSDFRSVICMLNYYARWQKSYLWTSYWMNYFDISFLNKMNRSTIPQLIRYAYISTWACPELLIHEWFISHCVLKWCVKLLGFWNQCQGDTW